MAEEAGYVLAFEFPEIPIEDPKRAHVGEEPEDFQILAIILRRGRDLPRDNVELSDVGKHGGRWLLWRILRRFGRRFGVDASHHGAVEDELFEDVVLGTGTPRSGNSGERLERCGAVGLVHVVDDELYELLRERGNRHSPDAENVRCSW